MARFSILFVVAAGAAACSHPVEEAPPLELVDDAGVAQAVSFAVPAELTTEKIYLGDVNLVSVSEAQPWHYGLVDLNPGARVRLDLFALDGSAADVGFKVYRVNGDGALSLLGVIDGYDGWAAATFRSRSGGSYVIESVGAVVPSTLGLFLECRRNDGDCSPHAQPFEVCGGRGAKGCDDGLFCLIEEGCGFDDGGGACQRQVRICPAVAGPPVCGCDGVTYSTGCHAHAAGINIKEGGACACDPSLFDKPIDALDVSGVYVGDSENEGELISSRLTLGADGSYLYEQQWDPKCAHVEPYCRRAVRIFQSQGTWVFANNSVQLSPVGDAPVELAQAFGVEVNCLSQVRLLTTETGIDRVLTVDPCSEMACAEEQHCELVQIVCITTPCDPVPQCIDNGP
jgi:hypothetical protein